MHVHLLKTAVGVAGIDHLRVVSRTDGRPGRARDVVLGSTRFKPRRGGEVIAGGSIYWIIKRQIRVRQHILGPADAVDDEGRCHAGRSMAGGPWRRPGPRPTLTPAAPPRCRRT